MWYRPWAEKCIRPGVIFTALGSLNRNRPGQSDLFSTDRREALMLKNTKFKD